MSWLSELVGGVLGVGPDSPQNKAIEKQQQFSQKQMDYYKDLLGQYTKKAETAYGTAAEQVGLLGTTAREKLSAAYGEQQAKLGDLFTSQSGQFQSLLGQVMTAGRQQAERSGLIGGAQEAALLRPTIENLTNSFATQAAQAQLSLGQQYLGAQSNLEQSLLGLGSQAAYGQAGLYGNIASGALSGLGGAGSQMGSSLGYYQPSLLSSISQLGGIAGLLGWQPFSSKA